MQEMVTVLISTFIVASQAELDVEDLISRGYTCSLADQRGGRPAQPGVETVCDDGVCSQCVKTGEGIQPWLLRNQHMEVEDYLRQGFVCSLDFRDLPEANKVCEDGLCVGCKKPLWTGGRGEVEQFLERGFQCFLVRDVPEYGLAPAVEVICEDGECFGCINISTASRLETPRSVDEMVALGYTCSLTRSREGDRGVVCEAGKCYQCQPPASQEFPVSARLLDEAEDHLEDGYQCGLTVSQGDRSRDRVVCEGQLCLVCWAENSQHQPASEPVRIISEASVRKVERLAKRGQRCVVVLGRRSGDPGTVCDEELCFICRN